MNSRLTEEDLMERWQRAALLKQRITPTRKLHCDCGRPAAPFSALCDTCSNTPPF